MDLSSYIESILFFKGTPVALSYLAKVLGKKESIIEEALDTLEQKLENRGLILTRHDGKVSLGTAPKTSGFIETLIKEDLSKDIGKAGLETLSVIIYKGPISRGQIDHIRGVNSSFILRNLLIRGLVERVRSRKDQRVAMYVPTAKLLSYLGVKNIEEVPQYKEVKSDIEEFEKAQLEKEKDSEIDGSR